LKLVDELPAGSRDKVREALGAAEIWHEGQFRGDTSFPYITHIYHVVALLTGRMGVRDTNLLVAASLHDVVEDCGVTVDELESRFGAKVATIVRSESENHFAGRREYMEHFRTAKSSVLLVKVADRIDNLRFVACKGITAFNPGEVQNRKVWPMDKVARYVIEAERYLLPYSRKVTPEGFHDLGLLISGFKKDEGFLVAYRRAVSSGAGEFRE
jgi:hypothetical protein